MHSKTDNKYVWIILAIAYMVHNSYGIFTFQIITMHIIGLSLLCSKAQPLFFPAIPKTITYYSFFIHIQYLIFPYYSCGRWLDYNINHWICDTAECYQ